MIVGIHDADGGKYPNLALMKLSAYHKSLGREVITLGQHPHVDVIYSSKVFSFTDQPDLPTDIPILSGGTGYGNENELPDHIEHIMPDYSIYNTGYSMGFLTRGCSRSCDFCIVPIKEGAIRENADIDEFLDHDTVVLMDNNILAHDHGIYQLEKIADMGVAIDINQGVDARLITPEIARLFKRLTWKVPLRLACDNKGQIPALRKAIETLRWYNVTPSRYSCYLLVRDIEDAKIRVRFLKGMGVDPFAQPYIPPDGSQPGVEQKRFARWVNHKAIFKKIPWEDYE